MFKRSEKKIKAVFAMQFQATQVPELKAKSLMISLVPVGAGKPTVRLPKAPIVEGVCTWESPVYETVKLTKEVKTGRIREKFYYLVVATGSSKAGFLGEVSIDFADLAEATKPRKLTLPLHTSKSGAILHVTVQKLQGDADSRHDEDNEASMTESPDDLSEVTSPHDGQSGSLEDADSDSNGDETSETSNDKFGRMTYQMKALERKAELSELEVDSLRKQIMKETKRSQQLSEQISCLTKERDAFKVECEQLKVSPKCQNDEEISSHTQRETDNMRSSLEDIKQALQREKQLNKKMKLHLQKTEDSSSEYVLAIRDLNKKLEHKNTEISRLSSKIKALYNAPEASAASPRTKMDESETSEVMANKRGNADEEEMLKQKIEKLYSEIEVHKKEKAEIQRELQSLTLDYKSIEIENRDIYSKLEQKEKEKMEIQNNYTESLATVKQYKLRVAGLEEEIKRQARQQSESLNMIDELESQVERLQNDLENQEQAFEEDLGLVTEAKIEQERRAIKAEEALRKTRLSNANAAERLQEEFKQLSAEMSLKIDENERIAQEAITEANDLHEKNDVLEELLQKAKDELQMTKEKYEKLLRKFPEQNKELLTNSRDESEQMRISKRWIKEKEDLERQLASVRKEAEKVMQENVSMKSQIDQKKTKEENLHLEVKKLRAKNNEVKNQLHELELEKGNMKKEMSKLQADLHKKQQESMRGMDMNAMVPEGRKNKSKTNQCVEQKSDHSGGSSDVSRLLSEVASLKERNKNMEDELKEMHERYSEISLRFAEVEGERQQLVMALRNLKSGKKN